MKIIQLILFTIFFISFFSIPWTHYVPSESGSCENIVRFISQLEKHHASSLFVKNDFLRDREFRSRALSNFTNLLDPHKLVLLSSQKKKIFDQNTEGNFCINFYTAGKDYDKNFPNFMNLFKMTSLTELESNNSEKFDFEKIPETYEEQKKKLLSYAYLISKGSLKYESNLENSKKTTMRALIRELNKTQEEYKKNVDGLILKAIVKAVDPHSDYFVESNYLENARWLKSSFLGVGVLVKEVFEGYKILDLVKGGPADRQNELKAGDIIISADGKKLTNFDQQSLSGVLGGPRGTLVNLEIRRKGHSNDFFILARRGEVKNANSSVSSEVKIVDDKKLARISLSQFYVKQNGISGVSEEVRDHLLQLNKKNVEGLILDLRGNLGGSLDEVIKIVGFFIKSGPVVIEYSTSTTGVRFYSDSDEKTYFDKPVVVLTDLQSASASEILAGSLKSLNRGIIVGNDQTYGKGTIQTVGSSSQIIDDDKFFGSIKLTTGYYFLPNGESVQFQGVKPHILLDSKKSQIKLEKDFPHALKKPTSIEVDLGGYKKWITDGQVQFTQNYLIANKKVREYLNKNSKDAKQIAFQVLADVVQISKDGRFSVAKKGL